MLLFAFYLCSAEEPADIVVYKEKGRTYAKIFDEKIAKLINLKKEDIIATTEEGFEEIEVLQKAVDIPYSAYQQQVKGLSWGNRFLDKLSRT